MLPQFQQQETSVYVTVACTDFEMVTMSKLQSHPLISALKSVQPLGGQLYVDSEH